MSSINRCLHRQPFLRVPKTTSQSARVWAVLSKGGEDVALDVMVSRTSVATCARQLASFKAMAADFTRLLAGCTIAGWTVSHFYASVRPWNSVA